MTTTSVSTMATACPSILPARAMPKRRDLPGQLWRYQAAPSHCATRTSSARPQSVPACSLLRARIPAGSARNSPLDEDSGQPVSSLTARIRSTKIHRQHPHARQGIWPGMPGVARQPTSPGGACGRPAPLLSCCQLPSGSDTKAYVNARAPTPCQTVGLAPTANVGGGTRPGAHSWHFWDAVADEMSASGHRAEPASCAIPGDDSASICRDRSPA
jgi:hypothetical protein